MFKFVLSIGQLCRDVTSSNKICFLLFGEFFTPNPKVMESMEQDAQLQKAFFFKFYLSFCICDALIQVGYNGSLHLFL